MASEVERGIQDEIKIQGLTYHQIKRLFASIGFRPEHINYVKA